MTRSHGHGMVSASPGLSAWPDLCVTYIQATLRIGNLSFLVGCAHGWSGIAWFTCWVLPLGKVGFKLSPSKNRTNWFKDQPYGTRCFFWGAASRPHGEVL